MLLSLKQKTLFLNVIVDCYQNKAHFCGWSTAKSCKTIENWTNVIFNQFAKTQTIFMIIYPQLLIFYYCWFDFQFFGRFSETNAKSSYAIICVKCMTRVDNSLRLNFWMKLRMYLMVVHSSMLSSDTRVFNDFPKGKAQHIGIIIKTIVLINRSRTFCAVDFPLWEHNLNKFW